MATAFMSRCGGTCHRLSDGLGMASIVECDTMETNNAGACDDIKSIKLVSVACIARLHSAY